MNPKSIITRENNMVFALLAESLSKPQIVALALAVAGVYFIFQSIYRLYYHPLAKFKGPWQAAVSTSWINGLHRKGWPEGELEDLHKKYNTHVIRIAPNELHITDVTAYDKIFSRSAQYTKPEFFYRSFLADNTVFTLRDVTAHKARRKLLNPAFSPRGIAQIEPLIQRRLDAMLSKITTLKKAVNITSAFRCLTVDIMSEFAFGASLETASDSPTYASPALAAFDATFTIQPLVLYSPTLLHLISTITRIPCLANLSQGARGLAQIRAHVERSIDAYFAAQSQAAGGPPREFPTVFEHLAGLPRATQVNDALSVLIAGSDTTAYTLVTSVCHILSNAPVRDALVRELVECIPDAEGGFPTLQGLQQLPYLRAVIQEALRVASPVPGRIPRVSHGVLVVDGMEVPPGTVVGMSATTMHGSREIWGEDVGVFNPDRWLGEESLEGSLVAFGKGPRNCIGMNLAYAELFMTLAHLFRKFDMEILEKHLEVSDAFLSAFKNRSNIVRFERAQK